MSAEYTFRIAGRLTRRLLLALEPLEARATEGDTLLVGRLADRAALYGFVNRIDALGLELVELYRLPFHPGTGGGCRGCGRYGEAGEQNQRTPRIRSRT